MKNYYIRCILAATLFAAFFAGCSLISLDEKPDDSERYGSLVIAPQSRAIDVALIKSAVVKVTGNGISKAISQDCTAVKDGKGSVVIERIPVGKRRIVSVYAKDSTGTEIDGGVIRAVVEIKGGVNVVDVINRQTSRKGNVYNALFEKQININEIKDRENAILEDAIPEEGDCDLERIDIDSLVNDFIEYRKNGAPLKGRENYILPEGAYLKRIKIAQTDNSSEENLSFSATAVYSDGREQVITENAEWISSDDTIVTVENGRVTLLKAGDVSISAEYSEGDILKTSPRAHLTVTLEEAGNPYIYLDVSGNPDKNPTDVNYAYQGATVAAWMWGTTLPSEWYVLEECDDKNYMRVAVPNGAEWVIFARGKSLKDGVENSWNALAPWNKTANQIIPADKNTFKNDPNQWGEDTLFGGGTGKWFYIDHGDVLESRIYAACKMEPSEDDTSLSSLTVNGEEMKIAGRVVYTVPYDITSATVTAVQNYSLATVNISPSEIQSLPNPGDVAEFTVIVTAKNGNTQSYIVRVKRSAVAPVDLTPYKQCGYLEDEEEGTITFIFDPDTWGVKKDEVKSLSVVGSFTASYNSRLKKWVENTDDFTLSWNENFKSFSLTVPREKVMRPGYSGQPEYKFYRNGLAENDFPSAMPDKYIFGNASKNMMILFKDDGEERLSELAENSRAAGVLKKLSDFDTNSDADLHKIANFRRIPKAMNVYRSYHPFYPTNEKTETERLRIEQVQKYAASVGIKSDINLCNDRTPKVGNTIKYPDGSTAIVTIPEYYKPIIEGNSVLYMGDNEDGRDGNGYIPNAKLVYYNSHSEIFEQWVGQLIHFINDNKNSAPFQIHCEIGVDRTGVFCAVLAGLCGATWDEIKADYASSNNMGIGEFRDWRILKYSLENMLGVGNVEDINIKDELYRRFAGGSVTRAELDRAVEKLTGKY